MTTTEASCVTWGGVPLASLWAKAMAPTLTLIMSLARSSLSTLSSRCLRRILWLSQVLWVVKVVQAGNGISLRWLGYRKRALSMFGEVHKSTARTSDAQGLLLQALKVLSAMLRYTFAGSASSSSTDGSFLTTRAGIPTATE